MVPDEHATRLADLSEDTGARMFRISQRIAAALYESGLDCEGVNVFPRSPARDPAFRRGRFRPEVRSRLRERARERSVGGGRQPHKGCVVKRCEDRHPIPCARRNEGGSRRTAPTGSVRVRIGRTNTFECGPSTRRRCSCRGATAGERTRGQAAQRRIPEQKRIPHKPVGAVREPPNDESP